MLVGPLLLLMGRHPTIKLKEFYQRYFFLTESSLSFSLSCLFSSTLPLCLRDPSSCKHFQPDVFDSHNDEVLSWSWAPLKVLSFLAFVLFFRPFRVSRLFVALNSKSSPSYLSLSPSVSLCLPLSSSVSLCHSSLQALLYLGACFSPMPTVSFPLSFH